MTETVTVLLGLLRAGDGAAAAPLWDRYFVQLVALARLKLSGACNPARDEEDVALSAFRSFCEGLGNDRFPKLESWEDVRRVLLMLTAQKAIKARRDATRLKRGGPAALLATAPPDQVPCRADDPAQAALMADEVESLIDALPDDQAREIVRLRLEGYQNREIADRLGCATRTVERRLNVVRKIWE